jgi:signal peptidase II
MDFIYKKKMAWFLFLAVFFLFLDRFLKILALNNFFNSDFQLFGNIFKFSLQKNYNIAFSLPFHGLILNFIIELIILLLICIFLFLYKRKDFNSAGILILLIFGAGSNLYDRIRYDYVIDYFDLKYFTVFNVADILIVSSVFLLGLIFLIENKKSKNLFKILLFFMISKFFV